MRRELPFPDPLVASGFFLRRAAAGPAEVATDIARTGRRVATGEAKLLQQGDEVVRAVATFTDHGRTDGRRLVRNEPPDLPVPDDAIDLLSAGSISGVSIADRVEYRVPEMPG